VVDIYIGIGSNIEPQINIKRACERLRLDFPSIEFSRVFESVSVGFEGGNFINLVACFKSTDLDSNDGMEAQNSLSLLVKKLKSIENDLGRVRGGEKFSDRHIDIDILLFGDLITKTPIELPRDEVLKNAYVLWPLVELSPDMTDPVHNKYYRDYWNEFDKSSQNLTPIELDLG